MKIEISYANQRKAFYSPAEEDLVGVTVIYDGVTFNVLKPILEDDPPVCEEIFFDESCKVIIRHFSSPNVADIMKGFFGFEGMKYIEIENSVFSLSVCV